MQENNDIFKGLESFLVSGANNVGIMGDPTIKDAPVVQSTEPAIGIVKPEEVEPQGFTLEQIESNIKTVTPEEGEEGEILEENNLEEGSVNADLYKTLSQQLIEEGIVESEFTSPEEMMNSFKEIIDSNINDYLESLPAQLKELVDNYKEGVPFDELLKIKSDEIRLDAITEEVLEESESKQKEIYKQYLKATTRFSDSRIEKEVTKAEDLGELLDNAKESLNELKELKKTELVEVKQREAERQAKAEQERLKTLQDIDKVVKSTKEIIPGIKLTEKEQKELYKMITTPQETRGNQYYTAAMIAREKDPIGFELKLNYFIKQGFFEENAKFDTIVKKVETKNLTSLEKQIEAMSKRNFNKSGNHAPELKNDTLEALKNAFNKK
jgi:hypothetical protein